MILGHNRTVGVEGASATQLFPEGQYSGNRVINWNHHGSWLFLFSSKESQAGDSGTDEKDGRLKFDESLEQKDTCLFAGYPRLTIRINEIHGYC